jgi:RNA polymerase subunit RPABC4/transcription elongation factor Spt4
MRMEHHSSARVIVVDGTVVRPSQLIASVGQTIGESIEMTTQVDADMATRVAKYYTRVSPWQGLARTALLLCAAALGSWLCWGRVKPGEVAWYGGLAAGSLWVSNWWRTRGTAEEVRVRALGASRTCQRCGGRVLALERACPRCGQGDLVGSAESVERWLPLVIIIVGVAAAASFVILAK